MKNTSPASASAIFSASYQEARVKFIESALAASARLEQYVHPLSGPNGEELATDVAELGNPATKGAVFVCSGTHGVEGFSGSAIQIGLLRAGWSEMLSGDVKIVLIHAINPYGFAYLRRFNEDNIDLNRNFLELDESPPENSGYDALASWMAPKSISFISEVAALGRLLLFAAGRGITATRQAVTGGQYRHPEGLFYGGNKPSWSAQRLKEIVEHHGRELDRFVFIDVHTGLGPFGAAEMISNSPKSSESYARAFSIWGTQVRTTKAGESVSADLAGTLKLAVEGTLPDVEATAVSIEYGTLPSLKVLRSLRAENWLFRRGEAGRGQAERIKANLLSAFNPDREDWRKTVLKEGFAAVEKAATRLARNSPS